MLWSLLGRYILSFWDLSGVCVYECVRKRGRQGEGDRVKKEGRSRKINGKRDRDRLRERH